MIIKIFGDNCSTCRATVRAVQDAAAAMDSNIQVIVTEDILEILRQHILQTPAVVIDGHTASMGRHLTRDEAHKLIEKYLLNDDYK